jgi:hypothetical protein
MRRIERRLSDRVAFVTEVKDMGRVGIQQQSYDVSGTVLVAGLSRRCSWVAVW